MQQPTTESAMRRTQELGAGFWNDSCDLGELRHAVTAGATGATSNPVLVVQALEAAPAAWTPVLDGVLRAHRDAREDEAAWLLVEAIAERAAALLQPVYARTSGLEGLLCVQVDPRLHHDCARMVEHGLRLAALAANIAVKVPATPAGIEAIEELVSRGVRTNATVCFTVAQALACAEAGERGIERARVAGRAVDTLVPWVTVMVGRLDDHLKRVLERDRVSVEPGVLDWAGIAVFKRAESLFRARNLRSVLLAAAYRHHLHWTELTGPGVVLSMPYRWWTQFEASGIVPRAALHEPVAPRILGELQRHFADFRAAIEPDGLAPARFASYGPTVHTLLQFLSGLDRLVQIVRARIVM
jgi:transaldolase